MLEPSLLGIFLLGLGGLAMGLTWWLMRAHTPEAVTDVTEQSADSGVTPWGNPEAKLVVAPGGRLISSNALAQEWLGTSGIELNLEQIARQVRPTDAFLRLCTIESQAQIQVGKRFLEVSSFSVPSRDYGHVMVVVLRQPMLSNLQEGDFQGGKALGIFTELSQRMAASLDLETTISAILETTARVLPADTIEVAIWNGEEHNLTPYHMAETTSGERRLQREVNNLPVNGFSGALISQRRALLLGSNNLPSRTQAPADRSPFRSYVGAPLLAGSELVGTLELSSAAKDAFKESDQELLVLIAGQAAIALHNAILFEHEQQQTHELAGLANLVQATGSASSPELLISRLVESLATLFPVERLGILLYDDIRRALIGQTPFVGIPAEAVALYQVPVPEASPADEIIKSQDVIIATHAPTHPGLEKLGLNEIAEAAGMRDTILAPLASAGRFLGYLQVANRKDAHPFDDNDIRLLTIVAGQIGPILGNAALIQEMRRRAMRAETLRRLASLAGSAATLDEILRYSLQDLARQVDASVATIYLLDDTLGELHAHRPSLFGADADIVQEWNRMGVDDAEFGQTVTASQRGFLSNNVTQDGRVLEFFRPLFSQLKISSLIDVPLIVRERGVGEIILASPRADFFDEADFIFVSTAAGQMAGAVERSLLYRQTDETLRRRAEELSALTRVSRELHAIQEPNLLLQRIITEAVRGTRANGGRVVISRVEAPGLSEKILAAGEHSNAPLNSLEQRALKHGQAAIATAAELMAGDPVWTEMAAAVALPLALQDKYLGVIHLWASTPEFFDSDTIEILQAYGIQAAIALDHVLRSREQSRKTELLGRRVDTLNQLMQSASAQQAGHPLEQSMSAIAEAIREATSFDAVLISVLHADGESLERVAGLGISAEQLAELRRVSQPWRSVQEFFQEEYRYSGVYFIPSERKPANPPELHYVYLADAGREAKITAGWDADDLLLAPLYGRSGKPLGLISVDAPRDGLRPDRSTLEALEMFATQAALSIEASLEVQRLQTELAIARRSTEGAGTEMGDVQVNLPGLLQKDLEQMLTIHRLTGRAARVQAGLEIADALNHQEDRTSVLHSLGERMLYHLDMDVALIVERSSGGPRLLEVIGDVEEGISLEALLGQRNPIRQVFQTGQVLIVEDLEPDNEWQNTALLQALGGHAFICLPVNEENAPGAAVLAVRRTAQEPFEPADIQSFELLGRQAALALRNLRLLDETNQRLEEVNRLLEFTRRLSGLEEEGILAALLESSLGIAKNAQAGAALLWDERSAALTARAAQGYSSPTALLDIAYPLEDTLPGRAYRLGTILRVDEVDFARDYSLTAENLLRYRDATRGRLPVSSLVVPLQAGERPLGVLVLDDFRAADGFSEADQVLIGSLARQAALAMENARLFLASQRRARQLEALTDEAGKLSANLQIDELVGSLLKSLRKLIEYDTGTLWLRYGERLTIKAVEGFTDREERIGLTMAVEDSALLREMIATGKATRVGDVRLDERFPSLIEPAYLSWLGLPLISKGDVMGVLALEKIEADYFEDDTVQVLSAFAGQAAVSLENAMLFDDSVRRAIELDEHTQRLSSLNRLSASLASSLEIETILKTAIGELYKQISCTSISILLFDRQGTAHVWAESPKTSSRLPQILPDAPLFDRMRDNLGVFNGEDITIEEELVPLIDYLNGRGTLSVLALPLVSGSDLQGVVLLHEKRRLRRFNAEEIELGRTICSQVSISLKNAQLYEETQLRSAELGLLFDYSSSIANVLDTSRLLDTTFEHLRQIFGSAPLAVASRTADGAWSVEIFEQGTRRREPLVAQNENLYRKVWESGQMLLSAELDDETAEAELLGHSIEAEFTDWMGAPLQARGETFGVIAVIATEPGGFSEDQVRLVNQIGNQFGTALDSARLFSQVQNYAAELEQRVQERTLQLATEHTRTETLLRIITELSASLDMDIVLNRTLGLINEVVGAEQSTILLVEAGENALIRRASLGYARPVPPGGEVAQIHADEGLAGWVIKRREAAIIPDVRSDDRWLVPVGEEWEHRSALVTPLMVGEDMLGVLMLYHRQASRFTAEDLDLVQATARQIAIALNNSKLFRLIRDQAERLGDMLRTQHIETSRSQAILEAVADGVLVTDQPGRITLFNASAERILGLERRQVQGKALESFSGLFGKTTRPWIETIRTWSKQPEASREDEVYSEKIELEDGRVVSVHLSPVRLRNEFLGTVSIFRDITHEAEVDRLKSEFVANVSHELRTPMTSIKGYVDILLMGATGEMTAQQRSFLNVVKSNTERLIVLVNDLLEVSRLEAGRIRLTLQPVDLAVMAGEVVEEMQRRSNEEGRKMSFRLETGRGLPQVCADPDRVRQILDNLVDNAYHYTPPKGKITLHMAEADGFVRVDVQDNGIGIPLADQEHIFERFYRGEDSLVLETPGTGLGLAVVKNLVEMHQGQISVFSTGASGDGSTFTFTLPVYQTENETVEPAATAEV